MVAHQSVILQIVFVPDVWEEWGVSYASATVGKRNPQ